LPQHVATKLLGRIDAVEEADLEEALRNRTYCAHWRPNVAIRSTKASDFAGSDRENSVEIETRQQVPPFSTILGQRAFPTAKRWDSSDCA